MMNEKQTLIVRYIGNTLGKTQTREWIGSIFEVEKSGAESYRAKKVIHNAREFTITNDLPSFYRYNAEILENYELSISIEDNLFELD